MKNYRLLVVINGLFFAAVGISSPLITLFYAEALEVDKSRIALLLTTVVLMTLVGSYMWGSVSDRLGRRKLLWGGGLFGVSLSSLLMSQAPNIFWAWPLHLIGSLATAAYTTLSLAILADVFSLAAETEKTLLRSWGQGRQMGLYRGLGSFAFAVGAIFGGRLADALSLRAIFVACAALYFAAGLCALFLNESALMRTKPFEKSAVREAGSTPVGGNGPAARQRLPRLFLSGVALWIMAHSASASMWPNYMRDLGYSKSSVGSLWGLAAFVEFPAMVAAGALSDVLGTVVMLSAGGFLIGVVNIGYLALAHLLPALLGIQIVRGLGFGSYTTSAMTFTTSFGASHSRGRTSGLFYATAGAGQLLGSYLGGTLADWRGFGFMYGFCATSALAAGLCFVLLRINHR